MSFFENFQGQFKPYSFTGVNVPEMEIPKVAADIMREDVFTINPNMNLLEAWQLLKDIDVHHFPVTNENDEIVGLLSDRDLSRLGHQVTTFPVADVMSEKVVTASPETPCQELLAVMIHEKFSSIPIVDSSKKVIGIVTTSDFLQLTMQFLKS